MHRGAFAQRRCAALIRQARDVGLRAAASTVPARAASTSPPPSPSASASSTAPPKSPAARAAFASATRFKLTPTQVNETNVPSAREVSEMIPTLRELRAQLPGARELEQQYIHPEQAAADDAEGVSGSGSTTPPASIFQKTTDPIEDLLFGPPKETAKADAGGAEDTPPKPQRQHLLLAYRALLWGTAYALLGFGATVAAAMYLCGFHSLGDLMAGVRGKMQHGGAAGKDGEPAVEYYVIDLTHPTEAWQQMQEVWSAVQRLAEEEQRKSNSAPGSL